jgi:putative transposase
MKHMAGRKRHSAEDIVRKLRRADELAAEGKTVTALGESPQVCSLKFPTCERLSVYRLAGSGGGAAQSLGGGVVVA